MGWIIAVVVFVIVGLVIIWAMRPMTGRHELATKRDWNLAVALVTWIVCGQLALLVFVGTG